MLVRDVMEKPVCIDPDATLRVAALKLRDHNTGCLVVCAGASVVGMLTDRDVLIRGTARMRDPDRTKVREAMSAVIHCCSETDTLEHAAEVMGSNHVHRLPVLNSEQAVVGIVSRNDVDHGASERAPFEVIFYKELTDSYGRPHHSELRRIVVAPGHDKDEAVAAAINQFEEDNGASWTHFADGYDVLEVRPDSHGMVAEKLVDAAEK